MEAAYWFIVAGILLLSVVFGSRLLEHLPLSVSTVYLAAGVLLGPLVFGLLPWEPVREGAIVEHLAEIAVLVSLFTVGLKWRVSLRAELWSLPVRLATVGMVTTIVAVALIGTLFLGLPLGAAVLLGAVLAPTDPVLASEVQVRHPNDRDPVRYALSGEAGLNDGLAFPFVMLGLGLLGLHPAGEAGFLNLWAGREFGLMGWLSWDLVWAVSAGLAVGGLTGNLLGHAVVSLLRQGREVVALNEFLVLGSIALSYGLAELVYGYGFLSVFAAGYAFRLIELRAAGYASEPKEMPREVPGDERAERDLTAMAPEQAAQRLASSLLDFNDQLERILEAAVVVVLGALLTTSLASPGLWFPEVLWLAPLLFLVVRPLSVMLALAGTAPSWSQRALMGWFGVRGVGSIYYLTYAFGYGIPAELAERLSALVLSVVAVSIVVHGVSVTPVMKRYRAED
ncbi:MAG: sodium:proton antiporter [Actinobacteria bacterium]|nr:MAG: sodium:proton antiporter [Actinomycetota bacterium]